MCSGFAPGPGGGRRQGGAGWVGVRGGRTPSAPLSDLSGRRPGSNVEMWLAGVDLIKSVHVSLQRGDPRLNHPLALKLYFSSSSALSLLSPYLSFFFSFFPLCARSLWVLPILTPPTPRPKALKAGFFPSLPCFFFSRIFVFQCFFPFSLPVCNWLFFCLPSPSFTLFILHSFSLCPFSRSFPFLGLPSPSTPFFLCRFYVHVFKAAFLCICVLICERSIEYTYEPLCALHVRLVFSIMQYCVPRRGGQELLLTASGYLTILHGKECMFEMSSCLDWPRANCSTYDPLFRILHSQSYAGSSLELLHSPMNKISVLF